MLYPASVGAEQFTRGDVDANGTVDLRDARLLFQYLRGRKAELICPDAADLDDNGVINYKDIRRSLRYLFRRGRPPAAPGPTACGADPTPDALGACVFDPCPQLTDENDPPEPWSPFESYLPADRSAELLDDLQAGRMQSALETALVNPGDNITLEFNAELALSLEGIEVTGGITSNPIVTLTEDETYEISFAYSRAKGLGVGVSENIQATVTESQSANVVFEFGNITDTVQALQSITFGEFIAPSLDILTEGVVALEVTLQAIEDLETQLPSLEAAAAAADAALGEAKAIETAADNALDDLADDLSDARDVVESVLGDLGDFASSVCSLFPVCRDLERKLSRARSEVESLVGSVTEAERALEAAIASVEIRKEAERLAKEAENAVLAQIEALRIELEILEAQGRAARTFLEQFDNGTRLLQARLSRMEFVAANGANVALFLVPFPGVTVANAGIGASLTPQEKLMLTLELDNRAQASGVTVLIGTEVATDIAAGFIAGLDAAATLTSDTQIEFSPDLGKFTESGVTLEIGLDVQIVGLAGIGVAAEAGAGREIGITLEGAELGPLLSSVPDLVAAGSIDGLQDALVDADATASFQDRLIGGGLFAFGVDEVGSVSGSATWSQVGQSVEQPLTSPDDLLDLFRPTAVKDLLQTLASEATLVR